MFINIGFGGTSQRTRVTRSARTRRPCPAWSPISIISPASVSGTCRIGLSLMTATLQKSRTTTLQDNHFTELEDNHFTESSQLKDSHFSELCSCLDAGGSCITQLEAHRTFRTYTESKEEGLPSLVFYPDHLLRLRVQNLSTRTTTLQSCAVVKDNHFT